MNVGKRVIHHTGVFITDQHNDRIKRKMESTIEMDFNNSITIVRSPVVRGALMELQVIASELGLLALKPTYNYCLDGKEIVCFQDGVV